MSLFKRFGKFLHRVFHPGHGGGSFVENILYLSGQAAAGDISFVVADVTVRENQIFARVGVRRAAGSNYDISVDYELEALTAIDGVDYNDVAGTLTWAEGDQTDKFIEIPLIDNFGADPIARTLKAKLIAGSEIGHCHIKTPNQATIRIVDDDVGAISVPVFRPQALSYQVLENAGSLRVKVVRSGSLQGAVDVNYHTVNGTASAGTHYTNTAGTLSWIDGEGGSKNVDIPITDNGGAGGDKTLTLVLDTPTNGAVVDVGYGTVAITIIDDESVPGGSPGEVNFSSAAYSINENAGTLSIFVSRTGGSLGAASVDYVGVDGSASNGDEYALAPGSLSWANGESGPQEIVVTINDNAIPFGDKAFQVQILNESGVVLGAVDLADILIQDDDALVDAILQGLLDYREESTIMSESDLDIRTEVVLVRPFGSDPAGGVSIGPSKPTISHYHSPDLTIAGIQLAPRPKAGRIQLKEGL